MHGAGKYNCRVRVPPSLTAERRKSSVPSTRAVSLTP
ncbi:hypothetical protein ERX37_04450 [Macrococcus hajekii]|uniref:Uncharacterized protein n=1 Tax=Macrococcus hajekii TaxID=198482 RepID=A0A4R6BP10_9STAP|nr:hypothetical protein ERX37_04450 [Macrococcus hajekii]